MKTDKKKTIYFGLDPTRYKSGGEIVHFPLIETQPFPFRLVKNFLSRPHGRVLFTSRTAVSYYFQYADVRDKTYLCVGKATAERLGDFGLEAAHIADEPCAEGVIELLEQLDYEDILYPHSAKARPLLPEYLKGKGGTAFALYDTYPLSTVLPDLSEFDQLVFTSPSTVEAFCALCKALPPREKCHAIGPVTQNALNKLYHWAMLRGFNLNQEEKDGKKI